jgi:hypothetical protein
MTFKRPPSSVFPPILVVQTRSFGACHPLTLRLVPHPLSLPHLGWHLGVSTYSSWWYATHGCWSWRDDGWEEVCREFCVLNLRDLPATTVHLLVTVRWCRVCLFARPPWQAARSHGWFFYAAEKFLIATEEIDSDRQTFLAIAFNIRGHTYQRLGATR